MQKNHISSMETSIDKCKCLASLAVFRELYDTQKDVYSVISEFLKEIICRKSLYKISLTEITELLNTEYNFKIPEAVVKTALSKINNIIKENGVYIINTPAELKNDSTFKEKEQTLVYNSENLINSLIKYIEKQTQITLSEAEKETVVKDLYSFLLDETTTQQYSEYISAFLLECKSDKDLYEQLHTIKEGVILYTGLKYSTDYSALGVWNSPLTIFIETEILFHFAGYNGDLFRILFLDFLEFVKEFNAISIKKHSKKRIQLKYFPEIKDEIERFFKKAEFIVTGRDTLDPSKTAMVSIVNGCKTASDIIEKKAIFYNLLKNNDIYEDEYVGYYSQNNHIYNIEDKSIVSELQQSGISEEDAADSIKLLNYVNIRRKGISNRNFENIGFVLLSGNSITIKTAWHNSIKTEGDVPLATTLNFLTNKLWFKLGKGFGTNKCPLTFNVITKAQIVLSSQLNDSISDKYQQLQMQLRSGELTEEQAKIIVAELKQQVRKPEDIEKEHLQDVFDCISEKNIEKYIEEHELFKLQAKKQLEENESLKNDLYNIDKLYREKEQLVKAQDEKIKAYEQEIREQKNIKIKKEFYAERKTYQSERKIFVKNCIKKTRNNFLKYSLFYVFLIALAIAANILDRMFMECLQWYIYIIVYFILAILPFILSCIKHDKILNSFSYIFSNKFRRKENKKVIYNAITEYRKENSMPIMKLI